MIFRQLEALVLVIDRNLELDLDFVDVRSRLQNIMIEDDLRNNSVQSTLPTIFQEFGIRLRKTNPGDPIIDGRSYLVITEDANVFVSQKKDNIHTCHVVRATGQIEQVTNQDLPEGDTYQISKLELLSANENESPVQRLIRMLALEKSDILAIYIYATLSGILSLTMPLGMQQLVLIATGGVFPTQAAVLLGLILIATLFAGIVYILQIVVVENIQRRIYVRGAFDFANKVPRFKFEEALRRDAPELMNRFFDIITIQKGVSKLLSDYTTGLLQVVFGLLLLSFYHPYFIFFSLILVILVYIIIRQTGKKGLETSLQESKYKYKLVHWFEQIASKLPVYRSNIGLELSWANSDKLVTGYLSKRINHFRVLITQYISLVAFKVFVTAGLLILGLLLLVQQQINLGQFVATEIILLTVFSAIEKILFSFEIIYDVLTGVEKVKQVQVVPRDDIRGVVSNVTAGSCSSAKVELRHLSYSAPGTGKSILKGINHTFEPGKLTVLTGTASSGKTVLLNIMSGMSRNYSGTIALNGIPYKELSQISIADQVQIVNQYTSVFEDTLLHNLTLGHRTPHSRIFEICDEVGLSSWISELPDGLQTVLSNNGTELSYTLRTKIVLAKALIIKPALCLIDDVVDRMHYKDVKTIVEAVRKHCSEMTIVMVSNHPQTMFIADNVMVMDDGKLKLDGTPKQLKNDPEFNEIMGWADDEVEGNPMEVK